jgi:hypothetical protein
MTDELMSRVAKTLDELGPVLESLNKAPATQPVGPDDIGGPATSRFLSQADQFELREKLRTKSDAELVSIFGQQLRRQDTGIPIEQWAAGDRGLGAALNADPTISKALDSGTGSALIRQDLEPVMQELFVREFPAWDLLPKIPSNGLVHAYNQMTSFGDAQFMAELGTVTDDRSTFVRQTTNIAILATRRGVSLKGGFAIRAGGGGYDPEQIEIQSGLRAIAHKMQKTIFQGNASDSGGTASTEAGAYDPNGFDGLRRILDTSRAYNVDPITAPTAAGNVRAAIDAALMEALNAGGRVDRIFIRPQELEKFNLQQDQQVRYMGDIARASVGVNVQSVNTIMGPLGFTVVPGDSIGQYTHDAGSANGVDNGDTVADIYFVDGQNVAVPYLGSPGPTVLDIPVGVSGQLVRLYIIFGMWGFMVRAPLYANKIRVKVA